MYRCLEGGAFGGSRLRIARIGGGGWCLLVAEGWGFWGSVGGVRCHFIVSLPEGAW